MWLVFPFVPRSLSVHPSELVRPTPEFSPTLSLLYCQSLSIVLSPLFVGIQTATYPFEFPSSLKRLLLTCHLTPDLLFLLLFLGQALLLSSTAPTVMVPAYRHSLRLHRCCHCKSHTLPSLAVNGRIHPLHGRFSMRSFLGSLCQANMYYYDTATGVWKTAALSIWILGLL
jgi:hypothetical protein